MVGRQEVWRAVIAGVVHHRAGAGERPVDRDEPHRGDLGAPVVTFGTDDVDIAGTGLGVRRLPKRPVTAVDEAEFQQRLGGHVRRHVQLDEQRIGRQDRRPQFAVVGIVVDVEDECRQASGSVTHDERGTGRQPVHGKTQVERGGARRGDLQAPAARAVRQALPAAVAGRGQADGLGYGVPPRQAVGVACRVLDRQVGGRRQLHLHPLDGGENGERRHRQETRERGSGLRPIVAQRARQPTRPGHHGNSLGGSAGASPR